VLRKLENFSGGVSSQFEDGKAQAIFDRRYVLGGFGYGKYSFNHPKNHIQ
jgi:hypothetical protein